MQKYAVFYPCSPICFHFDSSRRKSASYFKKAGALDGVKRKAGDFDLMKLTLQSMIRASFKLDKMRAHEIERFIIATEKDKKDLRNSVKKSNAFLFNDVRCLATGLTTNFLGFHFVRKLPSPECGEIAIEIDGFVYFAARKKKCTKT